MYGSKIQTLVGFVFLSIVLIALLEGVIKQYVYKQDYDWREAAASLVLGLGR
ncbi:MAG: hypothetical protein RLZZ502_13, partial [Pseudomonadota bacterium]